MNLFSLFSLFTCLLGHDHCLHLSAVEEERHIANEKEIVITDQARETTAESTIDENDSTTIKPTTMSDIDNSQNSEFKHLNANEPRQWTVSVALPGTVMDNMLTPQLQSYYASQIARVAAIFCINEVVVFCESEKQSRSSSKLKDPEQFLVRLLRYLETPQFGWFLLHFTCRVSCP